MDAIEERVGVGVLGDFYIFIDSTKRRVVRVTGDDDHRLGRRDFRRNVGWFFRGSGGLCGRFTASTSCQRKDHDHEQKA